MLRRLWLYLILALIYLPFFPVIVNSFATQRYMSFPPQGLTLQWYRDLPASYWIAFYNSLLVAALGTMGAVVLGTFTALAIDYAGIRHAPFFRTLFNLPIQVPSLVMGIVALQFYFVVARWTGVQLLGSLWGLVAAHIIVITPYVTSSVGSVLVHYDHDLDNAARTLGAPELRVLCRVTLPILAPGVMAGMIYAFIMSFGNVPVSLFLIGPDFTTLPILVFQVMEFDYRPTILAISTVVMAFSFVIVWLANRLVGLDTFLRVGERA